MVVRKVAVERADYPVAIEPYLANGIFLVAVRIGVAGRVEPDASPAFSIVRRGKQTIDLFLIGSRTRVGKKCIDFTDGWRKACKVEAQTPQQRDTIGFRRRLE